MDEFSYWEAAKRNGLYEDNRVFQQIASEAAQVGLERQLSPDEFEWGVHQLYDAYSYFLSAMNPIQRERSDQQPWHNHFRDARLGKKLGEPPISQELLSGAAYAYLKGPLRVPTFDRSLLDAFIAQETFAYIDRHAGRGAFLTQLGCFGSFLIAGLLGDVLFGGAQWTPFWRGLGVFLVIMLVIWAWPKRGPYALFRKMKDTYQLLTGSVVSVAELRRRVEKARDRGVVWPAELYAVLDDIEARTKVL